MLVYNHEEVIDDFEGDNPYFGIFCIGIALFFDGWLGYEEDKAKVQYNPSSHYMMAHSCLISMVFGFICILLFYVSLLYYRGIF